MTAVRGPSKVKAALAALGLGLTLGGPVAAAHAESTWERPTASARTQPVNAFVQLGLGLVELANVKGGVFLGNHVAPEVMVAWAGVFGMHYGLGLTGLIGTSERDRPPRHAFLAGARVMMDHARTFDGGGDDLHSYVAFPLGYSYLSDGNLFFSATVAPAFYRKRGDAGAEGSWSGGGPLFNVAFGTAF